MAYSDLPGGGVMAEPKDKVEEEKEPDLKKTREYRRFKKLLKQVIKAPSLKRTVNREGRTSS
jgi:hypothetical protein